MEENMQVRAIKNDTMGINQMAAQDMQDTIDLLELGLVLLQKWWEMVLGLLIGGGIAFFVSIYLITPQYEASTLIYVLRQSISSNSSIDLNFGSEISDDFKVIGLTRDTLDGVIEKLDLDTDYQELQKIVTISNDSSSRILEIKAKSTNPRLAADISNATADVLRERIVDTMNIDKPTMLQRAEVPREPATPNVVRNTEIGALLGIVLVAGLIILAHLLDDTITTEEDVRKYLGLDVLASVPSDRQRENRSKKNLKKKKRKKSSK